MVITNYGELKTAVADWLDRTDLVDKIPQFIQLAENAIFRDLRCPGNESLVTYAPATDGIPTPGSSGVPATFVNNDGIEIPNDYLEVKLLLYGGIPLTRISDARWAAQNYLDSVGAIPAGTPVQFSRITGDLVFFPPADENQEVTLIYYQSQGPMAEDTDYTRTLRYAPGLYLYGALLQAQAYLIGDERLKVWGQQFSHEMAKVNDMTEEDEVGGSTVTIRNTY